MLNANKAVAQIAALLPESCADAMDYDTWEAFVAVLDSASNE